MLYQAFTNVANKDFDRNMFIVCVFMCSCVHVFKFV